MNAVLTRLTGTPDEWPMWRSARLAALAEAPEAFPGAAESWTEGGEQQWRERLLDQDALKLVWITAGSAVGLVRAVAVEDCCWLHSLWVDSRVQGGGIARRLVGEVESWARERKPLLRLRVTIGNRTAINLYERLGYAHAVDYTGPRDGEIEMFKTL